MRQSYWTVIGVVYLILGLLMACRGLAIERICDLDDSYSDGLSDGLSERRHERERADKNDKGEDDVKENAGDAGANGAGS